MLVRANEWKRHLIAAITLSVVAAVALFASAGQSTASSRVPSCCDSIAVALAKEAVEEISAPNTKIHFGAWRRQCDIWQ